MGGEREDAVDLLRHCADKNGVDDVEIDDLTEKTAMLGVYGPRSIDAVGNILPFEVSGIEEYELTEISFFMINVVAIRGSWVGIEGMELLCPASVGPMAIGALEKYHKRENITPAGMDCLETAQKAFFPFGTGDAVKIQDKAFKNPDLSGH